MFKPKRHKPVTHNEDILHRQKKIQCRLGNINDRSLSIILSLNELNSVIKKYQIQEPSYEEKYSEAEKDLFGLFLDDNLEILIKEITEELCGLVPLHDYMIMGFIKRGIKKWQIRTSTPILAFKKMDPHEKFQVISDILAFTSLHMAKAIYSRDKQWKEQMKLKIFHCAIETYEEVISAQDLIDKNQEFSELHIETTEWR